MSGTRSVPLDALAEANGSLTGQPLCPSCKFGYVHPFKVEVRLPFGGWEGADHLAGWVAVCVGNRSYKRKAAELYAKTGEEVHRDREPDREGCGFAMPMTPHRYGQVTR